MGSVVSLLIKVLLETAAQFFRFTADATTQLRLSLDVIRIFIFKYRPLQPEVVFVATDCVSLGAFQSLMQRTEKPCDFR